MVKNGTMIRWVIGGLAIAGLTACGMFVAHIGSEGHGVTIERTKHMAKEVAEIKTKLDTMAGIQALQAQSLVSIKIILEERLPRKGAK